MEHIGIINLNTGKLSQKNLLTRVLGKFYTPHFIGDRLSNNLLEHVDFYNGEDYSIIDPFCGDGRLIVSFLRQGAHKGIGKSVRWHIHFWDCDEDAVSKAHQALEEIVLRLGLRAELYPRVQDSFVVSEDEYDQYDCVITNPPWETLKPDRRELEDMNPVEQKAYREALNRYDQLLRTVLNYSQPSKKYGGWGTNLSRCGAELAGKLTKSGGVWGLVAPMSLFNDQVSANLRKWILSENSPFSLDYYPAEAKPFDGVDQEIVAICFYKKPSTKYKYNVTSYGRKTETASSVVLETTLKALSVIDYTLPIKHGDILLYLLDKWQSFQSVNELEGVEEGCLWIGRELDETRHKTYLEDEGRFKFLKGRMVGRYRIVEHPTQFVNERQKRIPETANLFRIVWRDVSRRSQARRMQATIIPPNIVTGNSLNVLHFHTDVVRILQLFVAIMNSFPFEFQIKSRLGTGHISASMVRKVFIPDMNSSWLEHVPNFFNDLELINSEYEQDIEILVAKAYGLERAEYLALLGCFEYLSHEDKAELLDKWSKWEVSN